MMHFNFHVDIGTSTGGRSIGPYRCPYDVVNLHNLVPTSQVLCLFLRAENSVDGCAADGTLTLECRFAILHGDPLRILHLSLCFAFDTVILISHSEVASLHLL